MNSVLADPPKYFRAPVSRGGDPRVDRNGGYRGAGIIRGVSVITKGEALGHGLWIDDVTLAQVETLINANKLGTKSRFTHGTMSGDALGKHVGRVMDAEADGDQVFADQHFVPSAHKSPDGDLAEYLMSLAEDDPTAYGISIAFLHDEDAMDQFVAAHSVDGEFRSPDPNNINHYPHVRIIELHSADSVDSPAANSGLFHREGDVAREAEAFVSYALGRTNERPDTQFGLDPDRARGFMARYFDTHSLSINKESAMAEQQVEPLTEQQPTALAIEVGSRVKVKAGMEHDSEHAGMAGTVGEMSTPAFGIRWDSTPDVLHKWYTEAELELSDEAPAEPTEAPETAASDQSDAKRFAEAFGEQAVVWHFIEGLTFDECRERQLAELKQEVESLKTKLAARPLDGEDSPVSFDTNERKRNGFASKIKVK